MILITGNEGYIGWELTKLLKRDYDVVGIDSGLYRDCFVYPERVFVKQIYKDIRDIKAKDLEGVKCIIHLAGVCNDPLGELDPKLTYEVNHEATVRLARLAEGCNVKRFIFSSSCSVYGANDEEVNEDSPVNPLTHYAKSKLYAEKELLGIKGIEVLIMRNATVFGFSNKLRLDLVVNDLTYGAYIDGVAKLNSLGDAWRPFIHIKDLCRVFRKMINSPLTGIVNVGGFSCKVMDIAEMVSDMTACRIETGYQSDKRNYRVSFKKLGFSTVWTLGPGIDNLYDYYMTYNVRSYSKFKRLEYYKENYANTKILTD